MKFSSLSSIYVLLFFIRCVYVVYLETHRKRPDFFSHYFTAASEKCYNMSMYYSIAEQKDMDVFCVQFLCMPEKSLKTNV